MAEFDEGGTSELDPKNLNDMEALDYFLSLKSNYEGQRLPWEDDWSQALSAYHVKDSLDTVYEGRAKIQVPIVKWKVNGLSARINKILFNVSPIGRIEDKKVKKVDKNIVELWNKFIFTAQLEEIDFKPAFKKFVKNKSIQGTAVAKITQEFEKKKFSFFEDREDEDIVVKDNTYFRNLLLTEFYSDVNKENIEDSQACIHTSSVTMDFLKENEFRTEDVEYELEDGSIVVEKEETGFYKNLHLITTDGDNFTEEQENYMQLLGLNVGQTREFKKTMKDSSKSGFIQLDECYGKFDLDGDGISEEVVCTIANGRIVIQLEPTPFKHKRFVRPFIVGRYEPIANCLYGTSNVVIGKNLLMELNAARAQATDARTRSVANMWYMDDTKNIRWDKTWRPGGVIHGQGQNGITPLINPNLSNVSINDSEMISRDIDQLWSLSPVQEGTTDSRLIPSTARGTLAVINQNDMALNDIIDNTIDTELKRFIEMIYERNLVFKDIDDLLQVWDEKDLARAEITDETSMFDLAFDFDVKILGNLELSNEVAHQNGWLQFLNFAQTVPPIAKRLDWQEVANKMLKSFGIKDESDEIWLDPQIVAETDQAQAESQQAQAQQDQALAQRANEQGKEDYMFKTEVDTEAKLVEMEGEAIIEKTTGQKVQ